SRDRPRLPGRRWSRDGHPVSGPGSDDARRRHNGAFTPSGGTVSCPGVVALEDGGIAHWPPADGLFCPSQPHAGSFGQPTTQAITQSGSPAGDLTDGQPHAGVFVSNFCIPPTGSQALDTLAGLPGPGSLSLLGNAQFFAVTSCLTPGC